MSNTRGSSYEAKSDIDDIEALSKKLTADLRRHIRQLGSFPMLSDAWCEMADHLGRIANITEMEQKLPKETAEATLWECEELALRYILEDGKLNLCLRNLVEFKEFEREMRTTGRIVKPDSRQKMDAFERGMGMILRNAWAHVEALQTTDLPLLIGYVADVLNDVVTNPEASVGKELTGRQEILVLHYMLGLCKRIDDIDEGRVMPLVLERRVVTLMAQHLHNNHSRMTPADVRAGAIALALFCDTEDFQTHKNDYVSTDDEKSAFVALGADFLDELVEEAEVRRQLRPLLDFAAQCERQMSK